MAGENYIASKEEIGQRIAARYAAEVIASLADEEEKIHGRLLWVQLHNICCAHVPCKKQQEEIMTEQQARRFGMELIPFGEFAGSQVDDIPLERLQWYADQRFVDKLRLYLKSRRIIDETNDD